jgi:putative transposase
LDFASALFPAPPFLSQTAAQRHAWFFLDCGGLTPLWIFSIDALDPIQSSVKPEHSKTSRLDVVPLCKKMPPMDPLPWPHAPHHQLSEAGTYFVTAGTYQKTHFFRHPSRLDVLQRGLLQFAEEAGWILEAWAVFSNHYHFIAHSPEGVDTAATLRSFLSTLHTKTGAWVNRLDKTPHRKVWHNFWETRLTFEKSYFARLNYVHQNPVRHGLVPLANQYPWGSARWFERVASPAQVQTIYRFKTEKVSVLDDFDVVVDW